MALSTAVKRTIPSPSGRGYCRREPAGEGFNSLTSFGSITYVMEECAKNPADQNDVADPFQRSFPQSHRPRNLWIARQAVQLRLICVFQNIQHVRAADAGWIINAGITVPIGPKRIGSILRLAQQIFARAEAEAIRRAGFDARRFESGGHTIG